MRLLVVKESKRARRSTFSSVAFGQTFEGRHKASVLMTGVGLVLQLKSTRDALVFHRPPFCLDLDVYVSMRTKSC